MNNEDIVVSIIVPIYNSHKTIESLLKQICEQSYKSLQIILVNDGSTDNSRMICEKYALKDRRICVINQNNKGPSAARNAGIKKVQGRFIRFLDSDDCINKTSIEDMVKSMLDMENIDLVIGGVETKRKFWTSKLEGEKNRKDMIYDMTNAIRGFYYGALWNKLYRTEIIKNNNILFKEHISWCEDYLFNLEYFKCITQNIFYLKKIIYNYKITEQSLVTQVDILKRIKIENICLEYLKKFAQDEHIYNTYLDYRAYIKHSQMCNLQIYHIKYSEFKKICLKQGDIRFWIGFCNSNKVLPYKIIKYMIKHKHYFILYIYIKIKEFFKHKFKNIIHMYYKNRKRSIPGN